jgi:hypothetical protein
MEDCVHKIVNETINLFQNYCFQVVQKITTPFVTKTFNK